MNQPYLTLQADYDGITVALCSQGQVVALSSISKMDACKKLMVTIGQLLQAHEVIWTDLTYLAVNQGPAPFTTLRVVITTANALNFAHNIPLVGIDGLQAFAYQYVDLRRPVAILLNAFSQDVYFSILDGTQLQTGWGNHKEVIDQLASQFQGRAVTVVGNGVDLYKDALMSTIPDVQYLNPNPAYADIAHVVFCAHIQWAEQRNVTTLLEPLYLKTQEYKPSM